MDEYRSRLIAKTPPSAKFGFQGLRAADSITVENCLPLDFLVACDWGLDGPVWDSKLRYFAVERSLERRIVWTHRSIVEAYSGSWGEELHHYFTKEDTPTLIIPYRSTEFLEHLSDETDGRISIIANSLQLKVQFDDKIAFRTEAEKNEIPVPPGEILAVGDLSTTLLKKWGPQLIITEQIGSSGNQTHLVENSDSLYAVRAQLSEKLGKAAPVIAAQFLSGPAIGIAALIFGGKPRLSNPSVMITGLKGCSMHRFDYAGSDYGAIAHLPKSALEQVKKATLLIGDWAAKRGYQGIFGVDFIIHQGRPYALEFNPRLLGTTQLMTELESRQCSIPPSIYWHLAELMKVKISEEEFSCHLETLNATSLTGFQLLLRNTRPYPVMVGNSVHPGVYVMDENVPRRIRNGNRISDLSTPDEILVTCSPPSRGTPVDPRGAFFKLEGLGKILDHDAESVTPRTIKMVSSFTGLLSLQECH